MEGRNIRDLRKVVVVTTATMIGMWWDVENNPDYQQVVDIQGPQNYRPHFGALRCFLHIFTFVQLDASHHYPLHKES